LLTLLDQTDTDEEAERLEREANLKKEEDEARKSNLPSSGTNTPSGRKEKRASDREDPGGMKKSTSSRSLKRPASPYGSDASGTDASTRKKKLKSKHISSKQPTPIHSRPGSPANVPSSSTFDPAVASVRRRGGAGSPAGSDTETDGAAMSDASRARRLKLNVGGSPPAQTISRQGSPTPTPTAAPRVITFPSEQDIRNAIPEGGISVKDLLRAVPHPPEMKQDFVNLVKTITRIDRAKGLLLPR
jgi:hypothetical protein